MSRQYLTRTATLIGTYTASVADEKPLVEEGGGCELVRAAAQVLMADVDVENDARARNARSLFRVSAMMLGAATMKGQE